MATIAVGNKIPRGEFEYIPYTPEQEDPVGDLCFTVHLILIIRRAFPESLSWHSYVPVLVEALSSYLCKQP